MSKKLTTGEKNLIKKFGLDTLNPDDPFTLERANRFSGEPAKVNAFGAKIFDTVIAMQYQYDRGTKINVQDFDRLRYLFAKLFQEAYFTLLD